MIFTKEILPVGKYRVRTSTGDRVLREFDEEYLTRIANTSNRMVSAGLKIPGPFDHIKEARPDVELNTAKSSFNNAGYWQNFRIQPNKKGKLALFGDIDAPGDPNDPNSPAFKVKNTNQEVSVSVTEDFEDGLGRKWTDGLLHVAVVNHAVVPDQEPFATVVNMSMLETGGEDEALLEELRAVLPKIRVTLPSSTNTKTFLRDLLVAVSNLPEQNQDKLEPVPIYMSVGDDPMPISEAAAKALVASGANNPDTNKPFTMEDLGFKKKEEVTTPPSNENTEILASLKKENDSLKAFASALRNKIIEDTKEGISKRLTALQKVGVISKEQLDSFMPKVEYQMSIVDGAIKPHPLTEVLDILETQVPKQKSNTPHLDFPDDAVIEMNNDPAGDLSDDDMEKALDALEKDGLL